MRHSAAGAHTAFIEALQLTQGACRESPLRDSGATHATRLRRRVPCRSLCRHASHAPSVQEAILSGERSGQLGPLLTTLADCSEENNEVTVRSLTSLLEPLILVALGLLVGVIAVSMFSPLFDLTPPRGEGMTIAISFSRFSAIGWTLARGGVKAAQLSRAGERWADRRLRGLSAHRTRTPRPRRRIGPDRIDPSAEGFRGPRRDHSRARRETPVGNS